MTDIKDKLIGFLYNLYFVVIFIIPIMLLFWSWSFLAWILEKAFRPKQYAEKSKEIPK